MAKAIDSVFPPLTKAVCGVGVGRLKLRRNFTDQDKTQCQRTVRRMILVNGASGGGESAIFKEVISRMQVKIQTDQTDIRFSQKKPDVVGIGYIYGGVFGKWTRNHLT